MITPSIRLFTLYILLFRKEQIPNANNDYMVVSNLRRVFMPGLLRVFPVNFYMAPQELDIDDYDIDRDELHIMDNREIVDICKNFLQTNSQKIEEVHAKSSHELMKKRFRYKLIKIPFTKEILEGIFALPVYNKQSSTTVGTQEPFLLYSNNEMLGEKFFLHYSQDSVPTNESALILHQYKSQKNYDLPGRFDLLIVHKKKQHISYGFVDKSGNIIITLKKNDILLVRIHIKTFIEKLISSAKYFACDYRYILDNIEFMRETVFNELCSEILTTTEIDFSSYIHEVLLKNTTSDGLMRPDRTMNINTLFLSSKHIFDNITFQRLILRLCNAYFDISSLLLTAHEIILYCDDSIIVVEDELPEALTQLFIRESYINGTMKLHDRFETLVLDKVTIQNKFGVVVNNHCTTIKITDVVGDLSIPFVEKYGEIFRIESWEKFILRKDTTGTVHELSICNAKLLKNWNINEKIWWLEIKNITGISDSMIIINEDCKYLSASSCTCRISLIISTFIEELELVNCSKIETFDKCQRMLRVLRLINNFFDLRVVFYEEGTEEICESTNNYKANIGYLLVPSSCNDVIFRCFIGAVDLSIFGLGQLNSTETRKIDFGHSYDNLDGVHCLSIYNGIIKQNFCDCSLKYKLFMHNVSIAGNNALVINENCTLFNVINCTGNMIISKILSEEHDLILPVERSSLIYIRKQPNGKYHMHVRDATIKATIFLGPKVENIIMKNVKSNCNATLALSQSIRYFVVSNCDTSICRQVIEVNDNIIKLRTSNVVCKPSTEEIFVVKKLLYIENDQLSGNITRLTVKECEIMQGYKLSIDSSCKYIYISEYAGEIISLGLSNTGTVSMQSSKNGRFIFLKDQFNESYSMLLYNCTLTNTMKIQPKVQHVVLKNVSVNDESKQGTNECSKWSNFFELGDLQSIVLSNIEIFDFRRCINLNYLRLENVTINQDVSFSNSLKILELTNVTLTGCGKLKLAGDLKRLHISGDTGESLLHQLFNTNITKSHVTATSKEKLCCYLGDIDFQRNFCVPEETETLHLRGIIMQEGQTLKINRNCRRLEITSFVGVLDITEAKLLQNVVLHHKLPRIVNGQWIYLDSNMINEFSMNDVPDCIFPNSLKTIVCTKIELNYSSGLIIGEECEELSIISCTGKYDLSRIKKLRKLVFYPSQHEKFFITFPDLCHVKELDIAYNGNLMYFKRLLVSCKNVKKLIIRALTFDFHKFDYTKTSKKDMSAYGYSKIEAKKIHNTYIKLCKANYKIHGIRKKIKLLKGIVNVLIQPIFNVRAQNTLETLGLLEFQLDESNATILGDFVALTKICVSYEMIDTIFLSNIPRNARQLEILRNLNTSEYFAEYIILSDYRCIKLLSALKCIEELTVEGHFLRQTKNFESFPPNLKHLKVSYFDYYESCFESNDKRFVLNKLTLLLYHNEESQVKWDDVERRIRIDEMLNYLSRYIELDKLEELIVEDGENEPYHYFPSKC